METTFPYWEERARRFAATGAGLQAICSYGMPEFYNRSIDVLQRRALRPWLRPAPGTSILELGAGVGRWSRILAAHGAHVTGLDLATAMVEEARRRTALAGLADRCEFHQADVAEFSLGRTFDRILCVTTLQHVVSTERMHESVARIAAHLAPGGDAVLLEAAPSSRRAYCNTATFVAREEHVYREAFADAGLCVTHVTGVDPLPLKTWFLPLYKRLPPVVANALLFGITAVGLPVDYVFGPLLVDQAWHKVFVLRHARKASAEP